ncbi:hypothetical protein Poli38472_001333 [Pythium oligandrum]|uniref:Uncharacterized protein n=1 Tax=Pythium oligandrum TaxID=41045 RepID=A0A8K1CUN4_PYTOL|nr:hypothetical protein Poli38472_001333 [Pythium oligandrum]|eukprot:TMW69177.1 hypothetical protein Poli38472_001333 [Pythium oligandrum]
MNDATNSTNSLRGKIFELLSHKRFLTQDQLALEFRSLDAGDIDTEETNQPDLAAAANVARESSIFTLTTQEKMEEKRFAKVDEICKVPGKVMYYRPRAKNFGALDALIVDGIKERCYGLQMTIGKTHPVAWKPLYDVLKHLREIELAEDFCLYFVVPPYMRDSYKRQPIRTNKDDLFKNPDDVGRLPQFACGVNAFGIPTARESKS